MAFVDLEIAYCNLHPSWQGVDGNTGYSILVFLARALLVGLYFLTATLALLARHVVREAREDFGDNEGDQRIFWPPIMTRVCERKRNLTIAASPPG
jgi:hypothetical protein